MEANKDKLREFFQQNLTFNLEFLRKMVEINSFTTNSQGVNQLGKLISQIFSSLEFEADFVQSSNPTYGKHLFLSKSTNHNSKQPSQDNSGKKPHDLTIACISHLDTVFSPEDEIQNDFRWREVGDQIYGPGVVDIKGGTAMIYMIMDAMKNQFPHEFNRVNWFLCLNASEEVLSNDFSAFCKERLPQDTRACLVFEGGTQNKEPFPTQGARYFPG
jgi:glutamate carboxypeptidase